MRWITIHPYFKSNAPNHVCFVNYVTSVEYIKDILFILILNKSISILEKKPTFIFHNQLHQNSLVVHVWPNYLSDPISQTSNSAHFNACVIGFPIHLYRVILFLILVILSVKNWINSLYCTWQVPYHDNLIHQIL